MTQFLGFSGPPRAGKDTIAARLAAKIEDVHKVQPQLLACTTPMREAAYSLLGRPYDLLHYEHHKDDPQPALAGRSIRQAMIALSEEHVKPAYGTDFWGRSLLSRQWDPAPRFLFVTDCGFPSEGELFRDTFGHDQCVWVCVVRKNTDFSKDSRGYVSFDGRTITVINDDDIDVAVDTVYRRLITEFDWDFD